MCQLTNSSLVIKKYLIKHQYIALLKSHGSTLWRDAWGCPPLPLVLVYAQQYCSICFSWQRLSQTLPGNRGGEMFWDFASIQCQVTDLLWEPQPVTGPACHEEQKQGKHICNPVSGWRGGQVCVLTILQLSANLAAARMAPVLSPTSASAKKDGTGDTATKVSEKQTWRVPVGALTHPMPHRSDCSKSLSSPINDAMLHFFLIVNPKNKMKIFNTSYF